MSLKIQTRKKHGKLFPAGTNINNPPVIIRSCDGQGTGYVLVFPVCHVQPDLNYSELLCSHKALVDFM